MRLAMNAFLPAAAFGAFSYQKPMSRYEQRPDALPADEEDGQVVARGRGRASRRRTGSGTRRSARSPWSSSMYDVA